MLIPIVSSATPAALPVFISIDAPNFRRAKRRALYRARRVLGIFQPVMLAASEHTVAVRMRQDALAAHAPQTPDNINGPRSAWWVARDRYPLYEER